jgi:hypothetical protein
VNSDAPDVGFHFEVDFSRTVAVKDSVSQFDWAEEQRKDAGGAVDDSGLVDLSRNGRTSHYWLVLGLRMGIAITH